MLLREMSVKLKAECLECCSPVRPVGSALPCPEELSLQVQILLLGELGGGHADVLHVSDEVSLREACVVHGARVPKDKVTGLEVDLDHFTATLLEPLDVFLLKDEEVAEVLLLWGLVLVVVLLAGLLEELVEELAGALHDDEATVLRAVGLVVQETLNTLHALALGRLVTVGPRGPSKVLLARQSDVLAVEGDGELLGLPELLEDIDHLGLCAGFPDVLLVVGSIAEVHATLEGHGKVVRSPGGFIVGIKAKAERLQPVDLLLAVVSGALGSDHAFYDGDTSLVELVTPVAVLLGGVVLDKVNARIGDRLSVRRHRYGSVGLMCWIMDVGTEGLLFVCFGMSCLE